MRWKNAWNLLEREVKKGDSDFKKVIEVLTMQSDCELSFYNKKKEIEV